MKRKDRPLESISGYGLSLVCPHCRKRLALVDLKDGDQAYWCHGCELGWRAGSLPDNARLDRRRLTVTPLEEEGMRLDVLSA
jgi:uncharacterized protein YbaR (Trm112 family)